MHGELYLCMTMLWESCEIIVRRKATESLAHVLLECPHLSQEQTPLTTIAADAVTALGGLCDKPNGRRLPWNQLAQLEQLGILLGNPTTYLLYSLPDTQTRKDWIASLLLETSPHIHQVMAKRAALIYEYYPELT